MNMQMLYLGLFAGMSLMGATGTLTGVVTDPQGRPVSGAALTISNSRFQTTIVTRSDGRYEIDTLPAGSFKLIATAPGFTDTVRTVNIASEFAGIFNISLEISTSRKDSLTVNADGRDVDIQRPDPAQRVLIRDELLDANPGRSGTPVSIPGVPTETASGGIKAPQYFAPGVAGDHGEPIAQYIQVGNFLLPNNLSANAHGNGYADPNVLVPAVIESIVIDGGAFNVREGNHSVDLAATYVIRPSLKSFATLTADPRDLDISIGWRWIAMQASVGNGLLDTLEHRQQYKVNSFRNWNIGEHKITALFLGYYGQSRIPGLVPIDIPHLHDTIDPRQHDQTHTAEFALNDVWQLNSSSNLQLSTYFRTYNLSLTSNFGDGLVRQSEFRTVLGGNSTYVHTINRHIVFMAGLDYSREAPRRDNLDRYNSETRAGFGPFQPVTSNNITLHTLTPFAALDGNILPWLHYNLGWRRDQIDVIDTNLLTPGNSFQQWVGFNSPKATLSLLPPGSLPLPSVSISFGQAFFTNDPRIGLSAQSGSLITQSHSYQVVVSKTLLKSDFRAILTHVTQSASLAKIDPDTGLQYDLGPSANRSITFSARHHFGPGLLQASVSKADARDLSTGMPVPEAPRLIVDVLGTLDRLPFGLQGRAEFEQVGRKPLGDGFISVPVREFRGALVRSFQQGRFQVGVHFQLASGYTGQTTEVLALPGESTPFERVVGVYLPSYATLSGTFHFGSH